MSKTDGLLEGAGRETKPLPPAHGAERPNGAPQPADPAHRQPAHIKGETLTAPETHPARDPNSSRESGG